MSKIPPDFDQRFEDRLQWAGQVAPWSSPRPGFAARVAAMAENPRPSRPLWDLVPAAAAVAAVLFTLSLEPVSRPPGIPPAQEWAMLENLDLLMDLDVIESLDEVDL